jgi:hypothetical protein
MAKITVKKKDSEAEQQIAAGFLWPAAPAPFNGPYSVGDWVVYEADGNMFVLSDAEFNKRYDK